MLTLDEFVGRARERGATLSLMTTEIGLVGLSDGLKPPYLLPRLALRGRLPSALVQSLCRYFDLSEVDFALDAPAD